MESWLPVRLQYLNRYMVLCTQYLLTVKNFYPVASRSSARWYLTIVSQCPRSSKYSLGSISQTTKQRVLIFLFTGYLYQYTTWIFLISSIRHYLTFRARLIWLTLYQRLFGGLLSTHSLKKGNTLARIQWDRSDTFYYDVLVRALYITPCFSVSSVWLSDCDMKL